MNQSPSPQTDAGLGRTILIADDDPRLRALLIWTLEMGQYRVLAAVDGLVLLAKSRTRASNGLMPSRTRLTQPVAN